MGSRIAASPRPVFEIHQYLRLGVLGSRLTRRIAQSCKGVKLSAAEWRVVMVLGHCGKTGSQDVSMLTTMSKVLVSRAVAGLLNAGLITRDADRQDRRYAILGLTEAGHEIYSQVVPQVQNFEAEIMAALSLRERAALNRVLAKIESFLAQAEAPGEPAEAAE